MIDPLTGALVLGGASSLIGGIANFLSNQSASDRAKLLQDQGMLEWMKVNIPDPETLKLALEQFVVAGELHPMLEEAIQLNPSQFQKIVTSADHKAAQNRALMELQEIGNAGGLRLQDEAALQDAAMEGNVAARANRQAITEQMARRGTGGSGIEVAAQLQGAQGDADRESRARLRIGANAQDRALSAIMGAGDLASTFRGQEFGEESAKASAADRIDMFNKRNLQDVRQRNVGSLNRAAESNLNQRQATMDKNTAQRNYEQEHNQGLQQQNFQNQAQVAAGKTGQLNAQVGNELSRGKNEGNFYSNLARSGSDAGKSILNYKLMDEYFKKH